MPYNLIPIEVHLEFVNSDGSTQRIVHCLAYMDKSKNLIYCYHCSEKKKGDYSLFNIALSDTEERKENYGRQARFLTIPAELGFKDKRIEYGTRNERIAGDLDDLWLTYCRNGLQFPWYERAKSEGILSIQTKSGIQTKFAALIDKITIYFYDPKSKKFYFINCVKSIKEIRAAETEDDIPEYLFKVSSENIFDSSSIHECKGGKLSPAFQEWLHALWRNVFDSEEESA